MTRFHSRMIAPSASPQTATHWGLYHPGVAGGRIVDVVPDERDPEPSPMGKSMVGTEGGAARIARPMVREGYLRHGPRRGKNRRGSEPFVAVDWDTALDLVAQSLHAVRTTSGNGAIFGGSYGWASAGRFHHAQSQLHRFLNCIGGYVSSVNTYSVAAMEVIVPRVLCGIEELMLAMPGWAEIARHTNVVVAFGGMALKNAQVNSGGVGRHTVAQQQLECRRAGVRFVNVSPIRDDMAGEMDSTWVAIRPGTDVALMLGLANTLVSMGIHDEYFVSKCCNGFDRFLPYLVGDTDGIPKDAAWAARICGLAEDEVRRLAVDIAGHRTLITASWSLQRQDHGEQAMWMAIVLAALSGSMGKPGGGFGSGYAAEQSIGKPTRRFRIAALPQGTNRITDFIPVARIADMLAWPGRVYDYDGQRRIYPDIRLIYWCGGNPFHHHQDLNRLAEVWQQPETVIVHEPWWNALARRADIVLPVTTGLERNDIASGLHDRVLVASRQAIQPVGESRNDYEILADVAGRLGNRTEFTEGRSADEWVVWLYEETRQRAAECGMELPAFDRFWEEGWVEFEDPVPISPLCSDIRAHPESVRLPTPSGRVEIFSEVVAGFGYDDCPGHPAWLEPAEWLGAPAAAGRLPLHLISNQPRTRLHSQYDNGSVSQASKINGREPLLMHPQDALERGLEGGDVVRVFNERGSCLCGLRLDDGILRRVVQLATGAWFDPLDPSDRHAMCVHGNPNVLTRDAGTSRLAQGPSPMTTLVEVEKYCDEAPPIRVFDAPPMAGR